MGLLDTVLGAAGAMMGGQQQQPQQGGLGGLGSLTALLPIVAGMLGNDSQHGGLGGLLEKFNQAGLGDVAKSWVGTGQNAPISGDQLGQVLGSDAIGDIAAKLGMSHGDAARSSSLNAQQSPQWRPARSSAPPPARSWCTANADSAAPHQSHRIRSCALLASPLVGLATSEPVFLQRSSAKPASGSNEAGHGHSIPRDP